MRPLSPVARASTDAALSDVALMDAIRGGDVAALGLLLERYRPALLSAAIRIVGSGPEAEDAFQETCLIALRHIGSVRDPEAVGFWLHTVLRRACLQQKRRRRGEVLTHELPEITDHRESPERRLERLELRDWVRGAIDRLPEALRVAAMLRYFGSYDSYDEVAAILGIPIGTVRSRLSEARAKLADALLASAGLIHDDRRANDRARERFWLDEFRGIFERGESRRFVSHFSPELLVVWSTGRRAQGRRHLAAEIDGDLAAGVRLDLERVVGSGGITVVEARFVNPASAPEHCPPGISLVLAGQAERPSGIHLHLAARPPRPVED
jgi:RNA polymerase sigma factor (sigma-70 family)